MESQVLCCNSSKGISIQSMKLRLEVAFEATLWYSRSNIAAYLTQTIPLDDCTIKFEIWDTAGQVLKYLLFDWRYKERYHSLAPMYYRGAHAAIIVYDVSSPESFARAKTWIKELVWVHLLFFLIFLQPQGIQVLMTRYFEGLTIFYISVKQHRIWSWHSQETSAIFELPNQLQTVFQKRFHFLTYSSLIFLQTALAYAEESDLLFMETSAMKGINVHELFEAIGTSCLPCFDSHFASHNVVSLFQLENFRNPIEFNQKHREPKSTLAQLRQTLPPTAVAAVDTSPM